MYYINEILDLLEDSFKIDWQYSLNILKKEESENKTSIPSNEVKFEWSKEDYSKLFSIDYTKSFVDLFKDSLEEKTTNLDKFIIPLKNNILRLLNLSIIGGEYIPIENYSDLIETISKKAETNLGIFVNHNSYYISFDEKFRKPILRGLRIVKELYKEVYRDPKKYPAEIIDISSEQNYDSEEIELFLLYYNCKIALVDHFLTGNKNTISKLFTAKSKLEKLENGKDKLKPIQLLLIDKCNILLSKVFRSIEKPITRNYTKEIYLKDNYDEKQVKIENFNIEYIIYEETKYPSSILLKQHYYKSNFEKIYKPNCGYKDFYESMKVINKDFDEKELDSLIDRFYSSFHNTNNRYDERAFYISLSFLYTKRLDYYFNNDKELEFLVKKMNNIQFFQRSKNINSFIIHLTYCKYLYRKIIEEFKNKNSDLIKKYLEELRDTLTLTQSKSDWCLTNSFIPFQSRYEECIYKSKHNIDVFISSSFMLPLNYDEIEMTIKTLENNYLQLESNLLAIENINEAAENIQDMKQKLEDSDKKNIQVLGIFSAVIAIVFTSAQTMMKFESSVDAIRFIVALGFTIGSFLLILLLVTSNKKIKTLWAKAIFSVSYFLIAISIINMLFETKKPSILRNIIQFIIDHILSYI